MKYKIDPAFFLINGEEFIHHHMDPQPLKKRGSKLPKHNSNGENGLKNAKRTNKKSGRRK